MAAKSRKVFGTTLALCALAAVLAATQAARPASAATCPPPPTPLQPFTPWADNGQYVLTTGGSFEPFPLVAAPLELRRQIQDQIAKTFDTPPIKEVVKPSGEQ